MKKIAIYFDEPGAMDYPFSKQKYFDAYNDLFNELSRRSLDVYFVRSFGTYEGGGRFSKSWMFDDNHELTMTGPITADVVLDRGADGTFIATDVKVINDLGLVRLCNDKNATQLVFKDISPKTLNVASLSELESTLPKIETRVIVFKPNDGWAGKGVIITDSRREILEHAKDTRLYPAVVQEFIDSSAGISGIVEGLHDLRVIVVKGKIVMAHIRQPKEGSRLANVSLGGTLREIPIDVLPEGARAIVTRVDDYLAKYGDRIYSIDMMYENGTQPYLIELNAKPGINPIQSSEGAKRYIMAITQLLSEGID